MLNKLRAWLKSFHVEISDTQLQLLGAYLDLIVLWNKKVNLVGAAQPDRIVEELFFDSLLPARYLPPEGMVLDIGSGGGIPAIPLKILIPTLDFLLLEPKRKKSNFLKEAIRALKLDGAKVLRTRIEELPQGFQKEGFHIITARAVMEPERILDIATDHLADGGTMVLFLGGMEAGKGTGKKRSFENFKELARSKGFKEEKLIFYKLPTRGTKRAIAIMKKGGGG